VSKERLLLLGDVLANPVHPGRSVLLFLPRDGNWLLSTPAQVIDLDEGDEELEDVETRTGFQYALALGAVRQIVTNARMQRPTVTPAELLRAFHFYYNRDAFIDFDKEPD
jgi:hypothetical protein